MARIDVLFGVIVIVFHHSNALSKFDPQFVDQFLIGCAANLNLSEPCAASIKKIGWFLNAYDTLPQQWSLFYTAYGNGPSLFMTDDRWQFNMMACFKSAAETQYSRSEYPMSYCVGTSGSRKNAFGICLPSKCSQHSDAFQILQEWMLESATNQSDHRFLREDVKCMHSRKKQQWTQQWDVIVELTINMCSLLLVSSSTVFHMNRGRSRYSNSLLSRIYTSFAISNNYKKLVALPKNRQNTIECLAGLRVILIVWVVVGHTICIMQLYLSNADDLQKDISTSFYDQWATNTTLAVTAFFVISATVSSYGWFLKWNVAQEKERKQVYTMRYWLKFYIHRIIRLLPAYLYTLITVTYKSTNHSYSSVWPYIDPYIQCRKHWLENVLLLNCFGKAMCLGWTWYISAEFFCYLVSPIFLMTLAINSRIGIAISVFTIGISSAYAGFLVFRGNTPPVPLIWSRQYGYDTDYYHHVINVYIRPEHHISAYVIGLLLGYFLTTLKRESQRETLTNTRIWLGWLIGSSFAFIPLFGLYPVIQSWQWRVYDVVFGGNFRNLWSCFIAWLIYACYMGHARLLNSFLSARIFRPLSALTYTVYLIHMVHVASVLQAQPFPLVYHGRYQIFVYVSETMLLSYFFASFAAFIAEYPAINLERMIFSSTIKSTSNDRLLNEDTRTLMHYGHKTELVANDQ